MSYARYSSFLRAAFANGPFKANLMADQGADPNLISSRMVQDFKAFATILYYRDNGPCLHIKRRLRQAGSNLWLDGYFGRTS